MVSRSAPLVDVIITGHNYGAWIGKAIRSVYAQTRRDYTLTVVDDASSDGTAKIADRCLRQAPEGIETRLLHTQDVGPSAARHAAIASSTSKFFLYFDADDLISPVALSRFLDALSAAPRAGFAFSDRMLFGELTGVRPETQFSMETLKRTCYLSGGVMVRRRAYEAAGGFRRDNWGYGEDWELWLDIAEAGWGWRHVAEPLFLFRCHMTTSLSFFVTRFRSAYTALRHVHHPTLYDAGQLRRARRVLRGMPKGWNLRRPYRTVDDCEAGLVENPGNVHLLFLLGVAYLRLGDVSRARQTLAASLAADPTDVQARLVCSVLQSDIGDESVRLGHEMLSMREALCRLLLVYSYGVRVSISSRVIQAARRLRPRSFYVDAMVVKFWEDRVRRMRRRVAFQLLDDPSAADAIAPGAHRGELHFLHNTASMQQLEGAFADAEALFERLLELLLKVARQSADFADELGSCYFHLAQLALEAKEPTKASHLFLRCLECTPDHRLAAWHVAKLPARARAPHRSTRHAD